MDDASMQMWLQLTKHRFRMHQATSNYWASSECGRWASAGHCFSKHVYKSDTASPSPWLQFSWAELWNEKLRLRFNGTPSLWSTTWRLVRRERLKGPSKIWEPETAETRNNSGILQYCVYLSIWIIYFLVQPEQQEVAVWWNWAVSQHKPRERREFICQKDP